MAIVLSQREHTFESRFLIAGEPYLCKPAHIFLSYSGKKPPKFVGFKIRSMPSRLVFLLLVFLECFGDDSRGGLEIQSDMCLAALFADSRINEGAMIISIKSSFMKFFLFCCGKLSTLACWSREKREERCEANQLFGTT